MMPQQFDFLKASAMTEIQEDLEGVVSFYRDQAELAAIAAGASLVTSLTDPIPADGTIELLQTGAGTRIHEVQTGTWVQIGWLGVPLFPTIAAMGEASGYIDGQSVEVSRGENGQKEPYTYIADSTLTADGSLIVTATGMAEGRLVSQRTVYADFAEMEGDVRPLAANKVLTVRGLTEYKVVPIVDAELSLSGGLNVAVSVLGGGFLASGGEFWATFFGASPTETAANNKAAIEKMYEVAVARGVRTCRLPDGLYPVSDVVISTVADTKLIFDGYLQGVAETATLSVLRFKNFVSDTIETPRVLAQRNMNYDYGLVCDTDIAVGAPNHGFSKIMINDPYVVGAKKAFRFGNSDIPNALVSEVTVKGGWVFDCPSVGDVIGSQTVISMQGCQFVAGQQGEANVDWDALPRTGFEVFGGQLRMFGGEMLMVAYNDGILYSVQPIEDDSDADYENPYGSILADGVFIETASETVRVWNPNAVTSPSSVRSSVQITGHKGFHAGDVVIPVRVSDADYAGKVNIGPGDFYCPVTRTKVNVQSASDLCEISVDETAFGEGFFQGLRGVSGGISKFSQRSILNVFNANDQVLADGVEATVRFISQLTGDDLNRFLSGYSTSTGIFTVPAGGLRDVCVWVGGVFGTSTSTVSGYILAGGDWFILPTKPTGSVNFSGAVQLGDLAEDATIQLKMQSDGAATTLFSFDKMIISARR
tara:strand:- start:118 stop:2235 length:2118 start_codon:yes stop_codon:yes gene_type:complete